MEEKESFMVTGIFKQKIISPASRLLSSRQVSIRVAGMALLLSLPALWSGFISDDFTLRFLLEYPDFFGITGGPQGAWDIFRFQGADRASFQRSFATGLWPWWSAHDFKIAFFRPFASLHHAIDFSLWPDAAWFMHLENVLLFCARVFSGFVTASNFYFSEYPRRDVPTWRRYPSPIAAAQGQNSRHRQRT